MTKLTILPRVWFYLFVFSLLLPAQAFANCPSGGGTLTLLDGSERQYVCKNTAGSTQVYLRHSELTTDQYTYVITDEENRILGYSDDRSIDLSNVPTGNYRVWGVAYTGKATRTMQQLVQDTRFSDDCFSVSDNFVGIVYAEVGSAAISVGGHQYYSIDDYDLPVVHFEKEEAQAANFTYVIVNYRKRIIGITEADFDFTNFDAGRFRVYGYTYTGELAIKPGDFLFGQISEGCFEKSSNYVIVEKKVPAGFPIIPDVIIPIADDPLIMASTNRGIFIQSEAATAEELAIDAEAARQDEMMMQELAQTIEPACEAYAGILLPDQNQLTMEGGTLTISATPMEAPILGKLASIQYLLVSEKSNLIEAVADLPGFMISQNGTYRIHTMVGNFNHPSKANYFDGQTIQIGQTSFTDLKNQIATSSLCLDLDISGATFIVLANQRECEVDAGSMTASTDEAIIENGSARISAEASENVQVPVGYEKIYLLTWFNNIIDQSTRPEFSVKTEGSYGIVCLIAKTDDKTAKDYLSLLTVAEEAGLSIFQLIEYIDTKGICASVSDWSLTEVRSMYSLSFNQYYAPAVVSMN